MYRIAVGINTYNNFYNLNIRQKACIQSLQALSNVTLYNIDINDNIYEKFINLKLTRTSKDIVKNSTKELPMSKDVFNLLSATNCDYFIYLNDDIIVLQTIIDTIINNSFDCYIASRIDTKEITDLKKIPTPLSYNVHGFDLFAIKKNWWHQNKKYFPNFVLGRYYWDTYYYCLCHIFGDTLTLNSHIPYIYHPSHESISSTQDNETKYNIEQLQECIINLWHTNVVYNFKNRIKNNDIKDLIPTLNEKEIEKKIFKTFYEKNFSNIC